jgi:DNA polymerase-1
MDRIVIIDGNSLVNRAFYAIQRPMITKDGFYTQGIYGFLSMLGKIRTDYKPTHMLVAYDRKAPTFRHLEYTEYKAGRKKMPEELAMEMPVLKEILKAMGIYQFETDGFEADDIIGTVSQRFQKEGLEVSVVSGDRDLLQLSDEHILIRIPKMRLVGCKYKLDHRCCISFKML